MRLNLPIIDQLSACQNLLIAGMGGGFDVFCGLPIYLELCERGQSVHLANFSFSNIADCKHGIRLTETLVGVTNEHKGLVVYFPELYLAQWFKEKRNEDVTIWSFEKTGVLPLLENYRTLVDHLSIDGILLIDGGVDSLMCGDEADVGTIVEDSVSLCAVNELENVPHRFLGSISFGAERRIAYAHVFENIAALAKENYFLGSCSLIKQMEVYQQYENAVLYAQNKPYQDPSVINSSIISAVRGEYGNYHLTEKTRGSRLWISPLMPIYWFFDLQAVADRNLILSQLRHTNVMWDALGAAMDILKVIPKRQEERIPLP